MENQATDRAFRIGQTRNVQVHKFVCAGTFEEALDELIERKVALAEAIVGTSEAWITEMSTAELRDLFALRGRPDRRPRPGGGARGGGARAGWPGGSGGWRAPRPGVPRLGARPRPSSPCVLRVFLREAHGGGAWLDAREQ